MQNREELLILIDLADQTQRYDDMVNFSKQLAQIVYGDLNSQERKLVVQAYKNLIASTRSTLKALQELESREERKSILPGGNPKNIILYRQYKQKLEQWITAQCNDVLTIIQLNLQNQTQPEAKVFFMKTQADFQKYQIECLNGQQRDQLVETTIQLYDQAFETAKAELKTTNPIRLVAALNFSVFIYETLHDIQEAISIAREAQDAAINDIEILDEENYKPSTDLLMMIRDNISEWQAEQEAIENQEEKHEIH